MALARAAAGRRRTGLSSGHAPAGVTPAYSDAVAVDPAAGRIYLAGNSGATAAALTPAPAGQPDNNFSGDGQLLTALGAGYSFSGRRLALTSTGKVVVVGYNEGNFALARYNTDGSPDASFGGGGTGRVTTNFDGTDVGASVAVDPGTDKLVVAGRSGDHFALARYHVQGTPDYGFCSAGKLVTPFGVASEALDLAVRPDGRVVAAGKAGGDFALASYHNSSAVGVVPQPPGGLWAGVSSATKLVLEWSDNWSLEASVTVERSADGLGGWTLVGTVGPDQTTFEDAGLAPQTTYYYRVTAYTDAGASAWSSVYSNTTLPAAPAAPTGVSAAAASETAVDVSWSPGAGPAADEFVIERKVASRFDYYEELATVPYADRTYRDLTASGGERYDYRVVARNVSGDSPPSSAAARVDTPLLAPSGFVITGGVYSLYYMRDLNVTWQDNSSFEDGFEIEVFEPDTGRSITRYTAPANATSWTVRDVQMFPGRALRVVAYTDVTYVEPTGYFIRSGPSNAAVPPGSGTGPAGQGASVDWVDPYFANVREGAPAGPSPFVLRRHASGVAESLTVYLHPPAGTARPGSDFTAPASVTFPAGAQTVEVPVSVVDDSLYEPGPEYLSPCIMANPAYGMTSNFPIAARGAVVENDRKIELIRDSDGDHHPGAVDRPAKVLRIGHWGKDFDFPAGSPGGAGRGVDGYDANGDILDGDATAANGWANFISRDPDRFYVRVTDEAKRNGNAGEFITATIGRRPAAGDEHDNQTTISLLEEADTGVFVSQSQLLTSRDLPGVDKIKTDDGHRVYGGFNQDPALRVKGDDPNDRTHAVDIDGSVRVQYGGLTYDQEVLRGNDKDERRIVEVRVRVFRESVDVSGDEVVNTVLGEEEVAEQRARDEIARANIAWAQAGIAVGLKDDTVIFDDAPDLPNNGANVIADGVFDIATGDATALMSKYGPDAQAEVWEVLYVGPLRWRGAYRGSGVSTNPSMNVVGVGENSFAFMSSDENLIPVGGERTRPVALGLRSLAHELGHALTNAGDVPTPKHIFYETKIGQLDDTPATHRRLSHDTTDRTRLKRKAIEDGGKITDAGSRLLKPYSP